MKNILVTLALLIVTIGATSAAIARPAAVPEFDSYVDGNQRLQLIALPETTSGGISVTLVYEDGDARTYRSVTVDPKLVATTHSKTFQTFLADIDPEFLTYVKASLADRLLHIHLEPRALDRAESTMFFPGADLDVAVTRNARAQSDTTRAE